MLKDGILKNGYLKYPKIPNDDNWTKLSFHRCLRIDGQFCPVIVEWRLIIEDNESIEAALRFQKDQEIQEEIKKFSKLIASKDIAKKNLSSNKFWQDKKLEYPNLVTLFIMLYSINASSAFTERFLSICGIIVTQRNQIHMKNYSTIELRYALIWNY
jgi:hypothetical protein